MIHWVNLAHLKCLFISLQHTLSLLGLHHVESYPELTARRALPQTEPKRGKWSPAYFTGRFLQQHRCQPRCFRTAMSCPINVSQIYHIVMGLGNWELLDQCPCPPSLQPLKQILSSEKRKFLETFALLQQHPANSNGLIPFSQLTHNERFHSLSPNGSQVLCLKYKPSCLCMKCF